MNIFANPYISALVFAIALPALCQEVPASKIETPAIETPIDQAVGTPALGTTVMPDIDASGRPVREAEELRLQRDDLEAQQEMAKFTRLIYIMATLQFLVSALGLWGLIVNLRATKNAINEAKNSRELSEEHFRREHRPWLKVTVTPEENMIIRDGRAILPLNFTVQNFGGSPALAVQVKARIFDARESRRHTIDEQLREADGNPPTTGGIPVFPGEPVSLPAVRMIFETKALDASSSMVLMGCIHYKSPYHGKFAGTSKEIWHRTGFVYHLNHTHGFPWQPLVPPGGILNPQERRLRIFCDDESPLMD